MLLAFLRWACGGVIWAALCVGPVLLSVSPGAVPRGCSTLLLLLLPSPWLVPRAGSIVVCSCTCLMRVCLRAGGPVCHGVSMGGFANHPCSAATGRLCFAACTNAGRPSLSSWVRTPAGLLLSPLARRWRVLRGSFPSGFFSTRWFLVTVAFPVCPGLPTVTLWASWPVLLSVCVWLSSSPPPCASHPLLSDLHTARCLSPAAPPRR
jgi:hypothetical protein